MSDKKVFVIHGRNESARLAMFQFLRSIGLQPLEWSQMVAETGKASPYIGEVLETGFARARAIVALMTPDDIARLRTPFQNGHDPAYETTLTAQPRQNVIFEAGMAMGIDADRTVIVELGKLRPMSDTMGRHVIRMCDSQEMRQQLADRLRTAGCDVDVSGTDWHNEGGFFSCLQAADDLEGPIQENEFVEYLDGLSGTELYWLAKAVANQEQTITSAGHSDPTAATLVSKGLLERVPFEPAGKNVARPHSFPTPVWRYLNEQRDWLFERTREKNVGHSQRLADLSNWSNKTGDGGNG